jgi:carbon storage regulator
VLSRKVGERLYIRGDITLEVLEIRGNRVRLGFVAPSSTRIYREEVYLTMTQERSKDDGKADE